jgi:hypothetical protein
MPRDYPDFPHHSQIASYLPRIAPRRIVPKPNVARLCGDTVEFADGSEEPADIVV